MASRARTQSSPGRGRPKRAIVVGAGVAGMATVLGLCQRGVPVLWLSTTTPHLSYSVCDREGIADPQDTAAHVNRTLSEARGLAQPAAVRSMTESASTLVDLLLQLGVPFNRDERGRLARVPAAGGTRRAGGLSGHYIVMALERALFPFETEDAQDANGAPIPGERLLERHVGWELLRAALDDNGVAVGVVAQHLHTLKVRHFVSDAVIVATGNAARLVSPSAASLSCNGSAALALAKQGAVFANADLVHFNPTCTLGKHKAFAIPSAVRELGARLWVPREAKEARSPSEIPDRDRDYFLERLFPEEGNLASNYQIIQAIMRLHQDGRCLASGNGGAEPGEVHRDDSEAGFAPSVYLDTSHLSRKLHDDHILDLMDPFPATPALMQGPLRVGPAATTTLGGLWVDMASSGTDVDSDSPRNHATSIPGLYAVGQACHAYHGASLVSGNSILSDLHGGLLAAKAVMAYRAALSRTAHELPGSLFQRAEESEQQRFDALVAQEAEEPSISSSALWNKLSTLMYRELWEKQPDPKQLTEVRKQISHVRVHKSELGRTACALRRLKSGIELAELMLGSARQRAATHQDAEASSTPKLLLAKLNPDGPQWLEQFDYSCAGQTIHVTDKPEALS